MIRISIVQYETRISAQGFVIYDKRMSFRFDENFQLRQRRYNNYRYRINSQLHGAYTYSSSAAATPKIRDDILARTRM